MFTGTFKDIITNILSFISGILAVAQVILLVYNQWIATVSSEPTFADWIQLAILISVAVVGYYTGKTGDGKAKSTESV